MATIPGIVILLLAIGINLVGDGLRDVLDPKLKSGGLARALAKTERRARRPSARRKLTARRTPRPRCRLPCGLSRRIS